MLYILITFSRERTKPQAEKKLFVNNSITDLYCNNNENINNLWTVNGMKFVKKYRNTVLFSWKKKLKNHGFKYRNN